MGSKFNYKREAEGDSIARGESDGKQNREQRERERGFEIWNEWTQAKKCQQPPETRNKKTVSFLDPPKGA